MSARTFGTAKLRGNTWTLELEPHVAMRAKRIFKRSDRGTPGKIRLTHSPEVAADLEWFASRYPIDFDCAETLRTAAAGYRETILRLEDILGPGYEARDFGMALPPRDYQAREAEVALANGFLLIADEVGLGKTVAGITVFADPRARPAVVVCPTHLPRQWAEEIRKFLPQAHVHIVKKGTPYELATGLFGFPDVVIVNYAKLPGWSSVLAKVAKTVVFDEIQALRSGGTTQRYAGAEELAAACQFRVGLSATPIYNYGGEIFNVFEILKPGLLGNHSEFVTEWCSSAGNGKYKIREPRAFGSWAREQFAMIRHTRAEVGRELPDVVKIVQTVDSDSAAIEAVEDRAAELETRLARARQKLGQAEARLERLVELRIDGEITPEEYATARGRVTAERDAARLELADLTDPAPSAERASAWMRRALTDPVRLWIELSPAARAAFAARVFFDGVRLSPDGSLSNPVNSLMLLPLAPRPAADPPMVGPEGPSANPLAAILPWRAAWVETFERVAA